MLVSGEFRRVHGALQVNAMPLPNLKQGDCCRAALTVVFVTNQYVSCVTVTLVVPRYLARRLHVGHAVRRVASSLQYSDGTGSEYEHVHKSAGRT